MAEESASTTTAPLHIEAECPVCKARAELEKKRQSWLDEEII